MAAGLLDLYRTAFARRSAAMAGPDAVVVDRPGVCGALGTPCAPSGRLLVVDDRAVPFLADLLPDVPAHMVNVLADASCSRELVEQAGGWVGEDATAMVCADLATVPTPALPAGLTLRPVRRTDDDPADAVPLEDAAIVCLRAESTLDGEPLDGFLAFLRSLPPGTRLLAAVDDDGQVHATAGASVLGDEANAYFVSTDPSWRHRGVATAMTAAALIWTREAGARTACLDASAAGLGIYRRLGFQPVSANRIFVRFH